MRSEIPLWMTRGIGLALGAILVYALLLVGIAAARVFLLVFIAVLLASALEAMLEWLRDRLPIVGRAGPIIVVYLTFFFPKGVLSRLAVATVPHWDVALVSLLITAVAVVTPLIFHRLIRFTRLAFLYVRPAAFRLVPARASGLNTRLPEGQLAGAADS